MLLDTTIASRFVLNFRCDPEAVQSRLRRPWVFDPDPDGPFAGANFSVIFNEALLNLDANTKPAADASSRDVGFAIPVKNPETGEEAGLNLRIFTAHPAAVPGKYKTSLPAQVHHEQISRGEGLDTTILEHLQLQDANDGNLETRFEYTRGIPKRSGSEANVRSAADPSILRIYATDQLVDLVKSVPAGIDRVKAFFFRSTIPEMRDLFDGKEELVAIAVSPWYLRRVFGR